MAIIKGFPPSNTISPSVRITEKDLSFVSANPTAHRAGLVGFASKGPINVPTLISSIRQLHTVFGYPHPDADADPYLVYAAEQYLRTANELYVVRVAVTDEIDDERAVIATIPIPAGGEQAIIVSQVHSPATITNATDTFFRWAVNGVESDKTLVLEGQGTAYTLQEVVDALNAQLADGDGIEFLLDATETKIVVQTTNAYGAESYIQLLSVQNAMYSELLIGTGMTVAASTGTQDSYPVASGAGTWDFSGLTAGARTLQIVVDGTGNSSIDNVVQQVVFNATTYTTATIVSAINAAIGSAPLLPGGFVAEAVGDLVKISTIHKGSGAKILVKTATAMAGILGFDGTTAVGSDGTPASTGGATSVPARVYGVDTTTDSSFLLTADSAGIEGNDTKVKITTDAITGTFQIDVYHNDVQVESWNPLTKDATSRYYVEDYLQLVSDYIRAIDDDTVVAPPASNTTANPYYQLGDTSIEGAVEGKDGIPKSPEDQDALLIGSDTGYTGMFALSEPEQIDIDLIACPGHSSTQIVEGLISLCRDYRMDCLAIIDPPFGLTVKEVISWQNGQHPYNLTKLDSDFAALYWPWVKINDTYNGVDIWIPPSGSVMATYAYSDSLGAPWMAPAGVNRGIVPNITDVFSRPTLDERDQMYGNYNAVNAIVQFPDLAGFMLWGQKTMQRRPTALDRVNVRRLMFYIEKRIRSESRRLLFEPNDDIFRDTFTRIASGILDEVKVARGLYDYIIDVSAELNTPDVIDRNEFKARIGVQPTKAVEFMFLEFSIHRTGSFENTSDTF